MFSKLQKVSLRIWLGAGNEESNTFLMSPQIVEIVQQFLGLMLQESYEIFSNRES